MKQAALSALGRWLWDHRVSDADFAIMMANELKVDTFSARTVEKWRYGLRYPSGRNMIAIKALTGVTADQMLKKAA